MHRRAWLLALVLVAIAVVSACGTTAGESRDTQKTREAGSPKPSPGAASPKPAATPKVAANAKPASPKTAAGSIPAPTDADRERYARATWAPGQLETHFQRHAAEGPYQTAEEYDAAARETIRRGTMFTYINRESGTQRIGFYDTSGNHFTALSRDGRRITTYFRPSRGEAYVRGLERSTYQ